jgi:hypothetical protein
MDTYCTPTKKSWVMPINGTDHHDLKIVSIEQYDERISSR